MIFDWILGATLFVKQSVDSAHKELVQKPELERQEKIQQAKEALDPKYKKRYDAYIRDYKEGIHHLSNLYYVLGPRDKVQMYHESHFYYGCTSTHDVKEYLKEKYRQEQIRVANGEQIGSINKPGEPLYVLEHMIDIMSEEEKQRIIEETDYNPPEFCQRDFFISDAERQAVEEREKREGYTLPIYRHYLAIGSPYAMYHQQHPVKSMEYLQRETDPEYQSQVARILLWFEPRVHEDYAQSPQYEKGRLAAVSLTYKYFKLRGEDMSKEQLRLLFKYADIRDSYAEACLR